MFPNSSSLVLNYESWAEPKTPLVSKALGENQRAAAGRTPAVQEHPASPPPHTTSLRSLVLTPQDTLPAVCLLHYRATLGFITSVKCLMMVPLMWAWIAKSKWWFVSCLSHIPVILKPTQKRRHITRGISLSSQLRSFKKFPNLNSCPSREWLSLPSNNLLRRHIKSLWTDRKCIHKRYEPAITWTITVYIEGTLETWC